MVKTNALNTPKHGDDFQNLLLFLGRKHILSVMHPIVRPISATKQCVHTLASLSLLVLGNVVIKLREAPSLLHQLLLAETPAMAVLPGRRIDRSARIAIVGHQQAGLIVHATVFICTLIVETQGIPLWDIFRFQFFFFHLRTIYTCIVAFFNSKAIFRYTPQRYDFFLNKYKVYPYFCKNSINILKNFDRFTQNTKIKAIFATYIERCPKTLCNKA